MADRWLWLIVGALAVACVLPLAACKPGGYTSQGIVSGYHAGQGVRPVQQPGRVRVRTDDGRVATCYRSALDALGPSWRCY